MVAIWKYLQLKVMAMVGRVEIHIKLIILHYYYYIMLI